MVSVSPVYVNIYALHVQMNFFFFILHGDRNASCVSGHFLFDLDNWLVHFWHSRIVQSISFLSALSNLSYADVSVSVSFLRYVRSDDFF